MTIAVGIWLIHFALKDPCFIGYRKEIIIVTWPGQREILSGSTKSKMTHAWIYCNFLWLFLFSMIAPFCMFGATYE